jgi:pimeloyl-ACP methyl ester carboxylesterase
MADETIAFLEHLGGPAHLVPGTSHLLLMERPDETAWIIEHFLRADLLRRP